MCLRVVTLVAIIIMVSIPVSGTRPTTCLGLLDQADSLFKMQMVDSAIVVGGRALDAAIAEYGEPDTTVARILHQLGVYNYRKANYAQAESLYNRALTSREAVLGPDHPHVAETLNNLGSLCSTTGRYDEASDYHRRALRIRETALGPDHILVAYSLNGLANIALIQGDYDEAEDMYERAMEIVVTNRGPDDALVGTIANNMAMVADSRGQYEKADSLYVVALSVRKEVFGPEHYAVGSTLKNLGGVKAALGQFAEAESLYQESLRIHEKAFGPDHPRTASVMNSLGTLCFDEGRYSDAEDYFSRVLAIQERALGPESDLVATALQNLANVYCEQLRYNEAQPLYERAIAISEKSLGADHPELASRLSNYANMLSDLGRYSEAEIAYKRAIEIHENSLGPGHRYLAYDLVNLAALYADMGEYAKSEPLYHRALEISEENLGRMHPSVASVLESYSRLEALEGKEYDAMEMCREAFGIRQREFQLNSRVLPEDDALAYSQLMRSCVGKYISCYLRVPSCDLEATENLVDAVLASKGLVSDGIFERQQTLLAERDPDAEALVRRLQDDKRRLSRLYIGGPVDGHIQEYRNQLDSLASAIDQSEDDLAQLSAGFRRHRDYNRLGHDRIVSLLPEDCALIEYMRYDNHDPARDTVRPHYLLVVVRPRNDPAVIDLGDVSHIDSLVSAYRSHFLRVSSEPQLPTAVDKQQYAAVARDLYDAVISPIHDQLDTLSMLFIAPDGGLNLVSFAGLIDTSGAYLIEKTPIHYLAAGRDIVRYQHSDTPGSGLLAMGDPDYTSMPRDLTAIAGTRASSSERDRLSRSIRSGVDRFQELLLQPLPHTGREIESVVQQWQAVSKEEAVVLLGADASEDNFKAEARGKRVVHLATHGYYFEDTPGSGQDGSENAGDRITQDWHPLLLSGLFFAGANTRLWTADSLGCDDGVLTAYEVSSLRLEGVKTVILSACETGLGEVQIGEGVYGLRRAFQLAGARTVISALWPVSDTATAELMSRLYGPDDQSIPGALRKAQLSKIGDLRSQGLSDHPFSWGAFIAMGDWRP